MKEVLIVFVVLLVLLIILSTLGGSIRIKENFEDDIPLYEESLLPKNTHPWALNPNFVQEESPAMQYNKSNVPSRRSEVVQEEKEVTKAKEREVKPRTRANAQPETNSPLENMLGVETFMEGCGNVEDVAPFEDDGDFASVQ